jgi:hypothetical protein
MSESVPPPPPADGAPEGTSGKLVVAGCAVLFLLVLATTLAMAVFMPKFVERRGKAVRATCADQLRVVGLAAQAYANDHGAFPHVRGAGELDGDATTADTPRAFRKLAGGGYLADPESLLCPAYRRKRRMPVGRTARLKWLTTPPAQDAGNSPTLTEFVTLSYGWTRRALTPNASADSLLAADKAVMPGRGPEPKLRGCHPDGWNALRVDGEVRWLSVHDEPFPGAWLSRVGDPRDGFLSVATQDDPSLLR